jgi:hypothetical protein
MRIRMPIGLFSESSLQPPAALFIFPKHNDHLDDGGDLEALQMGGRGSGAVFYLGLDSDLAATVDHLE